jgi:hypothetical protein
MSKIDYVYSLLLLALVGCSSVPLATPTLVTPKGIRVDSCGQDIRLDIIDRQTDEFEACMRETSGNQKFTVARESIIIKTPDDWVYSCDKSQQLLNIKAGDAGCIAKGLTPTEECPCRYRVRLYSNVIFVTPSLYMLKDGLFQAVIGGSPWFTEYAKCVVPSVPKLPQKSAEGTWLNYSLGQ